MNEKTNKQQKLNRKTSSSEEKHIFKKDFKIFRFAIIIIGLVFLANPLVGLLDFFPDFIGYFLLIWGFDRIKRLNGDLEYGVKNLKLLCGISLGFFVLMFFTFKMDSSWVLTLTFSYMVLNIIFGTIAANGIFNGLDYLTDRHATAGFPSAFEPKLMTKIYIWVKAALVTLPELYAIVEVNAAGDVSPEKDYAVILATEKYALAVCFLCSIGLAIAWLKYAVSYCKALKSDNLFNDTLLSIYKNDFSVNGVPVDYFSLGFGSGLILVSHIFIYDFVIDTIHFLPEFISIILAFIGIFILRKYISAKGLFKYGIPAFAFQIAIFLYRNKYIENVILDILDITALHLVISSVLALGYIVFTFLFFSELHEITSSSYENIFQKKLSETYEWGDVFFLVALICSGANVICCIWRPTFVAVMILSLFISIYNFTKIYTKFN